MGLVASMGFGSGLWLSLGSITGIGAGSTGGTTISLFGTGSGLGTILVLGITLRGSEFWPTNLSTLRGGGMVLSSGSRVGACGVTMLVMMETNCWSGCVWLSVHGARNEPGLVLRNNSTMSCRLDRIKSMLECTGMWTLVGNHSKVSHIYISQISQVHTWKHRCNFMFSPMYQASRACAAHVEGLVGLSCTRAHVPGRPNSIWLKSNVPWAWAHAESLGLIRDPHSRLSKISTCGNRVSHRCKGKFL